MAIVLDRSQRWRVVAAHVFLICLCAGGDSPSWSCCRSRCGPATSPPAASDPRHHQPGALALRARPALPGPDGNWIEPELPVLRWLWNSVKGGGAVGADRALLLSTTGAYALARMKFVAPAGADRADADADVPRRCWRWWRSTPSSTASARPSRPSASTATGRCCWPTRAASPMHIWTIKGYYDTIPHEVEEAARSTAPRPGRPSAWCCCRWHCADPGGGVPAGLHRRADRIPGGLRCCSTAPGT